MARCDSWSCRRVFSHHNTLHSHLHNAQKNNILLPKFISLQPMGECLLKEHRHVSVG